SLYSEAAERRRTAQSQGFDNIRELFEDLKTRLEGNFVLMKQQLVNVQHTANDMIYSPTCTSFGTIHVDLIKYIHKNHASMGLSNALSTPAREQYLAVSCRKFCSSVRNAFCQDIRDSISHPTKKTTLAVFTHNSAMKYCHGQYDDDMGVGYTIHNALLVSTFLNLALHRK
ncbi:hypothetical protein FIBSPDRAFT_725835, partial [Athelia psychrophila]